MTIVAYLGTLTVKKIAIISYAGARTTLPQLSRHAREADVGNGMYEALCRFTGEFISKNDFLSEFGRWTFQK